MKTHRRSKGHVLRRRYGHSLEEPFRGYAHVLALPKRLDEAMRVAHREAKKRGETIYIGSRRNPPTTYVVWRGPISEEAAAALTYDNDALKTMPWLDIREMARNGLDYKFEGRR